MERFVLYSAVAIGGNSEEVSDYLEKHYKKDISVDEAISLAINAINLKSDDKRHQTYQNVNG